MMANAVKDLAEKFALDQVKKSVAMAIQALRFPCWLTFHEVPLPHHPI